MEICNLSYYSSTKAAILIYMMEEIQTVGIRNGSVIPRSCAVGEPY